MITKRILTVSAMSVMALGLIAASACGSDTKSPGGIEHVADGGDDAAPKIGAVVEHDPTTIEPADPNAVDQGMLIGGDAGADGDMIVVLDGAIAVGSEGIADPTDGTRLNDDELYPNGEPRGGVEPLDTDSSRDLMDPATGLIRDPAEVDNLEVSDGLPLAEGVLNPDSCENVLPPAPEPFEIKTHSATDSAKADNSAVKTMCTAWYASDLNEHSVSVALILMSDVEAAADHYDVLRSQFSQGGIEFEEQLDRTGGWLTATIDQGGIGSMVVLRIGENLVSVHNGPTSDQKEWDSRWMLDLAHSTLERVS